jgi:hypothetical protein
MTMLYERVLSARAVSAVVLGESVQGFRIRLLRDSSNVSLCVPAVRAAAVQSYRRRVKTSPTDVSARNNLASMLMLQGGLAEAASQLRTVLQIDPTFQSSRNNLLFLGHIIAMGTRLGVDMGPEICMSAGSKQLEASSVVRQQLEKLNYPSYCQMLRKKTALGAKEQEVASEKCRQQLQWQIHRSVDEGTRRLCAKHPAMPLQWHKHKR